jgi:hypothetical protein
MDGLLSVAPNCAKLLLSYLLPYSQRSIALVKRLAGSPKGAEIDPNHANKSVTQGSTRILIYIDGSLSVAPTVKPSCYLTFFHIPNVQLH